MGSWLLGLRLTHLRMLRLRIAENALFDDGNEVEDRPQDEGPQRHAEQVLAAADQRKNGVQEAERVQSRGHRQPDDAHFSHGVVRYSESKLPVYRGVAERTLT